MQVARPDDLGNEEEVEWKKRRAFKRKLAKKGTGKR